MLRKVLVAVLAIGLLAGMGVAAEASFLDGVLVPGFDNTFEDQSRAAFVDVNHDGMISGPLVPGGPGDVIAGFIRLDDRSSPAPAVVTTDHIYAIFTYEIKTVTPVVAGVSFGLDLINTTVPGLKLDDIIGPAGAGGSAAVFSKVAEYVAGPGDLIITSPGNLVGSPAVTLADYFAAIQTGTLDIVAGISDVGPPPPPPVVTFGDFNEAFITTGTLANAFFIGFPSSGTFGSTAGGLEVLKDPACCTLADVVFAGPGPASGRTTIAELAIARGALGGSGGLVNEAFWTNITDVGTGAFTDTVDQCSPTGAYTGVTVKCGMSDKADFVVHPLVATPEGDAASLLILGIGALGLAVMGHLRLRRTS